MSFIYGGISTDTLPGVTASLQRLKTLAGLSLETVDVPGEAGVFTAQASRGAASHVFDVRVKGATPAEAIERARRFSAFVDPARGPRPLNPTGIVEPEAWQFPDARASDEVDWRPHTWDAGNGYQLEGELSMQSAPHARPTVDESWQLSGPGVLEISRSLGDAVSYPTIEVRGTLSASQTVALELSGFGIIELAGPLMADQVARLDYDVFDFARWQGAAKVASLVTKLSTLDRVELWPDIDYTLTASATGTLDSITVSPNSRTN